MDTNVFVLIRMESLLGAGQIAVVMIKGNSFVSKVSGKFMLTVSLALLHQALFGINQ